MEEATFQLGQGVSFWLGLDGLGQVEGLLRTHVDVLYLREGRLCRRRVSAHVLAIWQETHPLLFRPPLNPFARVIVRPQTKTYRFDRNHTPKPPPRKLRGRPAQEVL